MASLSAEDRLHVVTVRVEYGRSIVIRSSLAGRTIIAAARFEGSVSTHARLQFRVFRGYDAGVRLECGR
jgi:hypothetical protein